MNLKNILFSLIIALSDCYSAHSYTMESSKKAVSFTIEEYKEEQHFETICAIMKADWEKIVIHKPYDPEVVKVLFDGHLPGNYPRKKIQKVIKDGNRAVGFITYFRTIDFWGGIEVIGVDREYRRCGCATALLNDAFTYITKQINPINGTQVQAVDIAALNDNSASISCYQKAGFILNKKGQQASRFLKPVLRTLKESAAAKVVFQLKTQEAINSELFLRINPKLFDSKLVEYVKKQLTYLKP